MSAEALSEVVLEITTRIGCRVACCFCPQSALAEAYAARPRSETRLLSVGDFERCLGKLPESVRIGFSGFSEPWLNPDCTTMLTTAVERGHPVRVHTTLQGMTDADLDIILDLQPASIEQFRIHLPSVNPGLEHFRVDAAFVRCLTRLLDSDLELSFSFHGTGIPEALARLLLEFGHSLPPARDTHTRAGNVSLVSVDVLKNRQAPARLGGSLECRRPGWRVLLPNGDVVLCCMDYSLQHVLGNLLDDDYDEVFYGHAWRRVVDGRADDSRDVLCRYCETHVYVKEPVTVERSQ